MLRYTVKMKQRGLRGPADRQAAMDVALRPVEDAPQLVPVSHRLERQSFDWRTGDDEPVEPLCSHAGPRPVEGFHVIRGRIPRHMIGDTHQCQFHLQGRNANQSRELGLGADLVRHQVQ
jgi:hypothetical protein